MISIPAMSKAMEDLARRHGIGLSSARRLAELKIYGFKRYQDHRRYLALQSQHVRRVLRDA